MTGLLESRRSRGSFRTSSARSSRFPDREAAAVRHEVLHPMPVFRMPRAVLSPAKTSSADAGGLSLVEQYVSPNNPRNQRRRRIPPRPCHWQATLHKVALQRSQREVGHGNLSLLAALADHRQPVVAVVVALQVPKARIRALLGPQARGVPEVEHKPQPLRALLRPTARPLDAIGQRTHQRPLLLREQLLVDRPHPPAPEPEPDTKPRKGIGEALAALLTPPSVFS